MILRFLLSVLLRELRISRLSPSTDAARRYKGSHQVIVNALLFSCFLPSQLSSVLSSTSVGRDFESGRLAGAHKCCLPPPCGSMFLFVSLLLVDKLRAS